MRKTLALVAAPALAAVWLTPAGATAAPSDVAAGQYVASAHSDIVDLASLNVLPGLIPGGGHVASVLVGHSKATADSAAPRRRRPSRPTCTPPCWARTCPSTR